MVSPRIRGENCNLNSEQKKSHFGYSHKGFNKSQLFQCEWGPLLKPSGNSGHTLLSVKMIQISVDIVLIRFCFQDPVQGYVQKFTRGEKKHWASFGYGQEKPHLRFQLRTVQALKHNYQRSSLVCCRSKQCITIFSVQNKILHVIAHKPKQLMRHTVSQTAMEAFKEESNTSQRQNHSKKKKKKP